jgi:hypothetical protein
LVFYYNSDAPFFDGIVRTGEFDGDMDALERQSDDFSLTIVRLDNATQAVGGSALIPREHTTRPAAVEAQHKQPQPSWRRPPPLTI